MALSTIQILVFLLSFVGAIVVLKILMLLLPMVSVRKISESRKRLGNECFYVRFRFPGRKKAVLCMEGDQIRFYNVSSLGKNVNAPSISFRRAEIKNLEKISGRRIYRFPFKGTDSRFRPPRSDIKFSCSGKAYALTFFGRYEKIREIIGTNPVPDVE